MFTGGQMLGPLAARRWQGLIRILAIAANSCGKTNRHDRWQTRPHFELCSATPISLLSHRWQRPPRCSQSWLLWSTAFPSSLERDRNVRLMHRFQDASFRIRFENREHRAVRRRWTSRKFMLFTPLNREFGRTRDNQGQRVRDSHEGQSPAFKWQTIVESQIRPGSFPDSQSYSGTVGFGGEAPSFAARALPSTGANRSSYSSPASRFFANLAQRPSEFPLDPRFYGPGNTVEMEVRDRRLQTLAIFGAMMA